MEVTSREYKDDVARELAGVDLDSYQLDTIDGRLLKYVSGVVGCQDEHNLYELLAVKKFLRLMRVYVFRASKVKKFVRLYESLKFSGMDGRKCYRLTPIQYFQFCSMLGF